jgi:branched-chain amino acid aminotransferase
MKAFMGADGQVRLFRWKDNAARLRSSADGVLMAPVRDELFHQAILTVSDEQALCAPFGSGASLYISL